MAEQDTAEGIQEETKIENGTHLLNNLAEYAVKTIMVGLGIVGFAQDELTKLMSDGGSFIDKLEERGVAMSESGREMMVSQKEKVTAQIETRQDQVKDLGSKANDTFESASGAVLTRANVPTAEDIQNLSKQINALSRKVDKVRKEQQELAAGQE
ncbi:MAG: phasin family protein [Candidatus Promineifilaceae bacterium]|nr:phasin family protein [Candidatus Promineifilaceae bacterium]